MGVMMASMIKYYEYNEQSFELFVGLVREDDRIFKAKCETNKKHMFAPYSHDCECGKYNNFDFTKASQTGSQFLNSEMTAPAGKAGSGGIKLPENQSRHVPGPNEDVPPVEKPSPATVRPIEGLKSPLPSSPMGHVGKPEDMTNTPSELKIPGVTRKTGEIELPNVEKKRGEDDFTKPGVTEDRNKMAYEQGRTGMSGTVTGTNKESNPENAHKPDPNRDMFNKKKPVEDDKGKPPSPDATEKKK